MRAFRILLLAASILVGSISTWAQAPVFTNDQAAYLGEITSFLVGANKKEGTAFVETVFTPFWNGPYLSQEQRARMVAISNVMGKKRFSAIPDYKEMLNTAAAFPLKQHSSAEFDAWLKGLEQAGRSSRKQDLTDYLDMSQRLLADNILYSTASSNWRSRTGTFTFAFDSVPKVVFGTTDLVWSSRTDSSVIEGTSGTFYPLADLWVGKGGTITWRRAGLAVDRTFVKWSHPYSLKIKTTE
ncbi:MAG: hypothetical protein ABIY71_07240, partial [Flavobacteriales bacterium]